MSRSARDEELIRLINEAGYADIRTLAEKTFTSCSTVRRDLQRLEQQGYIRRRHGGAESVLALRPTSIVRRQLGQQEKAAAAKEAAALVRPGMTIFIDASTTVQYMIPHLTGIAGLTVWTNGIDTAMRLADAHVRAVSTGGELFTESMAYVGAVAAEAVRKVSFDAVFFSSAGFDDQVVSDWSEAETALRRVVLEQSARRYFLADHTKKGKRFTHIVCPVSGLTVICR